MSYVNTSEQIMEELRSNGVDIYKFPTDDETVAEGNAKMNVGGGRGQPLILTVLTF